MSGPQPPAVGVPVRRSRRAVPRPERRCSRVADGPAQLVGVEPRRVVGDEGPGGGQVDRGAGHRGQLARATAGCGWRRRCSACRPARARRWRPRGSSASRGMPPPMAAVSMRPLAHWSGGVPGFGDGGTDLLHVQRGRVVLDHRAGRVEVDQGCRHALHARRASPQ